MTTNAATTTPPLRVTHLIERNFKRIESIDIHTDQRTLIMLQGPNENGKTSALDGLIAALGGKSRSPVAPVRKGHESGTVEVTLGDDNGPKYKAVRTFSPDGASTLRLYDATNPDRPAKLNAGQTLLDGLIADISFDPLAFIRADKKHQIAMLMAAAGMRERFEELQRQRMGVMDCRKEINRIIEHDRGRFNSMPHYPDVADRIDEAAVQAHVAEAEAHNLRIDTLQSEAASLIEKADRIKEGHKHEVASIEKEIAAAEQRIEQLRHESETRTEQARLVLTEIKNKHAAISESIAAAGEKKTIAEVSAELERIRTVNAQIDANKARDAAKQKLDARQAEADKLTAELAKIDAESVSLLEQSTIGQSVPGLSVRDGGIWHNGVPIEQASGMRKLELSALIGMASNNRLRIMCIDEADKLDDESLSRLVSLAKERNYQLWATAVRIGQAATDDFMVLPIKDGTVAPTSTATAKMEPVEI